MTDALDDLIGALADRIEPDRSLLYALLPALMPAPPSPRPITLAPMATETVTVTETYQLGWRTMTRTRTVIRTARPVRVQQCHEATNVGQVATCDHPPCQPNRLTISPNTTTRSYSND